MFLYKGNIDRADNPMNGKPFMKVYIDTKGHLKSEFTRITGGGVSATTPKPIPF